jgi:hypothetical protein
MVLVLVFPGPAWCMDTAQFPPLITEHQPCSCPPHGTSCEAPSPPKPYRSLVNDRAWWEQETDMHDLAPWYPYSVSIASLSTTLSTRRFVNPVALDDGLALVSLVMIRSLSLRLSCITTSLATSCGRRKRKGKRKSNSQGKSKKTTRQQDKKTKRAKHRKEEKNRKKKICRLRESNPRHLLGRRVFYH